MKRKAALFTILAILMVFALAACGGNKSADTAGTSNPTNKTEATATPVSAPAKAATHPAATATPAPPTATPEPPTPTAEPTQETANFAKIEDVVKSYHSESRVTYTISTEPPVEDYTTNFDMTMSTDWVKADNPFGSNTSTSIKGLDIPNQDGGQDAPQEISMISVDDTAYVKMGDQWISVPRDQADSEQTASISLDDLVQDMKELKRVGKEKVNGINTIHYQYKDFSFFKSTLNDILLQELQDKTDVAQFKLADAKNKGDIWIAKKGGYVVKVDLNFDATFKKTSNATDAKAPDKIHIQMSNVTNVSNVNGDITIELPADAPKPGEVTAPGFEPGTFPLPEQTTVDGAFGGMTSLSSKLSPDEINAFFDKELTKMGWTKADGVMPTWSKDGNSFLLMVTPGDDGVTSITILPNQQ